MLVFINTGASPPFTRMLIENRKREYLLTYISTIMPTKSHKIIQISYCDHKINYYKIPQKPHKKIQYRCYWP